MKKACEEGKSSFHNQQMEAKLKLNASKTISYVGSKLERKIVNGFNFVLF